MAEGRAGSWPRAITAPLLGEYWISFIPPHWNEYGISKANQQIGLVPPLSGMYENSKWMHSNGAWIRSEIWACLAPGCPDLAIRYAYEDASVDHGGGEGTYAALFTAAVQSAAFVVNDRDELIRIGLSKIPPDCRVARSISIALDAHKQGASWQQARERVVADSEDLGWFQAPANVAFVIIGWMYGEGDFGKSITIATNCGDDTDCTAATLGATFGILLGRDRIPAEWTEPIGERIITLAVDRGSAQFPKTITELTDAVMAQAPIFLGSSGAPVGITDGASDLSGVADLKLADTTAASAIWSRSPYSVIHDFVHARVILDYGRDPVVRSNEPFSIRLTFINQLPGCRHVQTNWILPPGWKVLPGPRMDVKLWAWPEPKTELTVEIIHDEVDQASYRGVLEIVPQGRPTVGLVPLLFLNSGR